MTNRLRALGSVGIAILTLLFSATVAIAAATVVKPGFNLFSVEQDVEIGRQSAAQVERQLPMLSDARVQQFVSALGARLAAQAPSPKFTYRFKVVNQSDLNAFALPGGFIYVNRGLLDQVRSEGELAGVMAHEIAHVALRHPTNQASKAYLAQAGLGVLGGLLAGRTSSSTGQIVSAIGGFGMNTLFLKFSRSLETQADIVGAQIMARSGYDPAEMANFFAYMNQKAGGDPGAVARFLSDHPAPADREARVRQEAKLMGAVRTVAPIGSLLAVQTKLLQLPTAPKTTQPATGTAAMSAGRALTTSPTARAIEAPSTRYRLFQARDRSFQLERPDNWVVTSSPGAFAATIAPRGGVVVGSRNQKLVVCGAIVNHYVPFDGALGRSTLGQATRDLVEQIQLAHPHLDRVGGSERHATGAGAPAISVRLDGPSPETGRSEHVTVVTRQLQDGHVVYLLMIAPGDESRAVESAFERMTRTFQVSSNAIHTTSHTPRR